MFLFRVSNFTDKMYCHLDKIVSDISAHQCCYKEAFCVGFIVKNDI